MRKFDRVAKISIYVFQKEHMKITLQVPLELGVVTAKLLNGIARPSFLNRLG